MSNLKPSDKSRFRALCNVVDKAIEHWYHAGLALIEIRDSKLYRDDFKTFEEFVRERFDIQKSHAYRLIEAAKVKSICEEKDLDVPLRESHCRVLADVPEDKIPEVVEAAMEGGELTAKTLEDAKERVVPAEPDESMDNAAPVGDDPEDPVENAERATEVLRTLRTAMRVLKSLDGEVWGLELVVARRKAIHDHINQAANVLKKSIPSCVCQTCNGAGCEQCGNHGWVV